MDLSKTMLIGRLVAKPELRVISTGRSVATFTIVTNRKYKSQEIEQSKATFHRVVCWNKTAEFVAEVMDKGSKAYVEGILEQNDYTDKQGIKRKSFEIIASSVIFLDRINNNSGNNNNIENNNIENNNNTSKVDDTTQNEEIEEAFPLDSIPF